MSDPKLKKYRGAWCAVWTERGEDGKAITRRSSLRCEADQSPETAFQDFLKAWRTPGDTIAEIFAAYLKDKHQTAADPDRLENAWKRLQPFWGKLRPDQITRELCREYIDQRDAGDGTIGRELSALRAAVKWHNPVCPAVFELPARPAPKDRHLTREEYARLLKAAEISPHCHLFIILALATGARAKAVLELSWNRVDFDRGIIRLSNNNENVAKLKGRAIVPMTQRAREELEKAHACAVTPFVIEYGGQRVKRIRKAFQRAVERAGLGPDVTPHVLRHTAAVWMAEAGIPITEIAQYLGHTNPKITYDVYARYSPDYLRGAAAALEVG